MKFNKKDLDVAIAQLSMLRHFPSDEGARAAIQQLLARMVPSREALDWLVAQYCNRIGEWRGPVELRAVLCWRYPPADGIEASSRIPGYTTEDGYERSLAEHAQRKAGGSVGESGSRLIRSTLRGLLQ